MPSAPAIAARAPATSPTWGDQPSALARRYRAYVLPLLYAGSAVRHWRLLSRLWNAPRISLLGRMIAARPEIWGMLRVRFISARWGARERLSRIIVHCELAEEMGLPFAIRPNECATLLELDEIEPRLHLVLDSPRWLLREGLLALSLVERGDRIFSLSFTLARKRRMLVAFVGGIQGRRADDALERNRAFTRSAAGTRPQDLLVELFRALCAAAGVERILCVSDAIRNGQTYFAHPDPEDSDPVSFDYDALWTQRGGEQLDDGFFDLPLEQPVRPASEIPSRRRAARRRKLALIATLRARLTEAFATPRAIRIDQIEPV